jgi:hypothetical protein
MHPYPSTRILALCLALAAAGAAGAAGAAPLAFSVVLTGQDRVPPVSDQSASTATAALTFDAQTRVITWNVDYSGVRSAVTALQLRGPAVPGKNGHFLVQLGPMAQKGVEIPSPIKGQTTLSRRQAALFAAGNLYLVLDSTDHPDGELRGQLVLPKT